MSEVKRHELSGGTMSVYEQYVLSSDCAAIEADRDALLEALELADAALSGANMDMKVVERKVKAAIAESRGEV